MNGADLLARELLARNVKLIATLCGHGLDPLDAACETAGIRLLDVRNEQSAGYIAESIGRLGRTVGVCAVSSGVAHANALTGVVNAHFDGAPMLLISGSGANTTAGLGHFQDLDQVSLAAPVCKYARRVEVPGRLPQYLHEAFTAALSGRPGPVHLTVPLDVLTAEVDPAGVTRVPSPMTLSPVPSVADPALVSEAVALLVRSERPLLIAGSGLYYARGEEALAGFARALSVPVVVPIWDRGTIPKPLDAFMGVLGAATGGPRLLADADLILMAGAAFDYRVGYLQPPAIRADASVVRIDSDPVRLHQGVGAHLPIAGDPRLVLDQIARACGEKGVAPKTAWLREAGARRDAHGRQCLDSRPAGRGMHALDLMAAVKQVLTEDTVLVIDGGNIGQWAHQTLCDRYPGHWLTCGASGVVGYGIPGAMAARVLYPDRPVILISGDGALLFTVAEIEAAARQRLPFVILLADDQAWGITLTGHQRRYGHGITSELGPVRYDQMAQAFGARGIRIERPEEIAPAILKGLVADRPTLIHVPVVRSNPTDR